MNEYKINNVIVLAHGRWDAYVMAEKLGLRGLVKRVE